MESSYVDNIRNNENWERQTTYSSSSSDSGKSEFGSSIDEYAPKPVPIDPRRIVIVPASKESDTGLIQNKGINVSPKNATKPVAVVKKFTPPEPFRSQNEIILKIDEGIANISDDTKIKGNLAAVINTNNDIQRRIPKTETNIKKVKSWSEINSTAQPNNTGTVSKTTVGSTVNPQSKITKQKVDKAATLLYSDVAKTTVVNGASLQGQRQDTSVNYPHNIASRVKGAKPSQSNISNAATERLAQVTDSNFPVLGNSGRPKGAKPSQSNISNAATERLAQVTDSNFPVLGNSGRPSVSTTNYFVLGNSGRPKGAKPSQSNISNAATERLAQVTDSNFPVLGNSGRPSVSTTNYFPIDDDTAILNGRNESQREDRWADFFKCLLCQF